MATNPSAPGLNWDLLPNCGWKSKSYEIYWRIWDVYGEMSFLVNKKKKLFPNGLNMVMSLWV